MKAIFMTSGGTESAYDKKTLCLLNQSISFALPVHSMEELEARKDEFRETEYIFSTWGMLALSEEQIGRFFPKLRAVFYAAGSVQFFAAPFLRKGIKVFSAWAANAVPVAEYTLAQILLAGKGFFQACRLYKSDGMQAGRGRSFMYPGNYGAAVGIIGAGAVGKLVIGLLKTYHLSVKVFDPFLTDEAAKKFGVEKTGLEELFSGCQVISNHLANNAQTKGMLNYALFSKMKDTATFINTGRGAQVVEEDLVRALREEPMRTAVLDVTDPAEPVPPGHPFLTMDNVILSPHIAGSQRDEVARMGYLMYEEFTALANGEPTRYVVTEHMLKTMA